MKKIKDLLPGEIFYDSLGYPLKVEKVEPIPWLEIPMTKPKVRVYFITESGHRMYQSYNAEREVDIA